MQKKIVDLTADIYNGVSTMPMDPKCSVTEHCNLDTLGYNLSRLTLSTHQGTHMDAPFHFFKDGKTIDKIDLSRCIVSAFRVDVTYKKEKESITIEDLLKYEVQIDKGLSPILYTGWENRLSQKEYFSDFPYISIELAEWFVKKKIKLLGLDFPCPNVTDWKLIHEILLSNSVIIVEGLVNLKELGNDEFTFYTLPLKIKGRDGSPVRAIAIKK
jgi:kynurenine formamidase